MLSEPISRFVSTITNTTFQNLTSGINHILNDKVATVSSGLILGTGITGLALGRRAYQLHQAYRNNPFVDDKFEKEMNRKKMILCAFSALSLSVSVLELYSRVRG